MLEMEKNIEQADDVLLSLKNIETHYGAVTALKGVSLTLLKGKITALLGANGAGKTSLLKSISGVLVPTKGDIVFNGQHIEGMAPDGVVRLGVVHVPEGREIFPFLTVEDNLTLGAYIHSGDEAIRRDRDQVYGYFPVLKELAKRQAGYLSGGQQQMLAIGRGLMSRPQLMLLDEPSLGLSPRLVKEIMHIVKRLNVEKQVTILLVEQNARVALEIADIGYVIEVGRIVKHGTAESLMASDDVKEFYLGGASQNLIQRNERRWKKRKTWR